ncbi:MarR family winged helix-turn-helix transcriptional regulator [Amycolatopsis sp.]|uniref:MarR family winged helix-turn-helix transcriptional regulator n=1 Tax=Amycolatopsis sp. TaxID=37632 RepID=UPI002C0C2ADA|nr:MarR family winged helix-turn-helix transcriptional regulator [Amycolatopsis sp.]HVV12943.1 MarR family winged helix-turn-helix transcriptional regulator [Amycolatopsis sp.]
MSQASTEARPGDLVERLQQLWQQACDDELRPLGLTLAQLNVLSALAGRPEVSTTELAPLVVLDRHALRDVLGGLRGAGLVLVGGRGSLGRTRPVQLTIDGRARLRAGEHAVAAVQGRMLAGFTPGDRHRLSAMLATCAVNLAR